MKVPFVDLRPQNEELRPDIERAMRAVMDRSQYILGPEVEDFESKFGLYLNAEHCVACGNATDGLEIILRALEIGKGDEVIIPSLAWISVAEVITQVGARPVFADVDPDFYTLDPHKLESLVTPATKAIMPVHLYGNACDMDPIEEVARKYELKLIEDCAQAHGVNYKDRKAGTLGHAAAFSFYPTKNLGALGDGGIMVTKDPELAERLRWYRNHGQSEKNVHQLEGRNSRMDDLQAAILNVKLKYLDQWNSARRAQAQYYLESLSGQNLKLPATPPYSDHNYHLFVIHVADRDQVQHKLAESGIETAVHYPTPLPALKPYKTIKTSQDQYQVAGSVSSGLLSLPLYRGMEKKHQEYVAENLIKILGEV